MANGRKSRVDQTQCGRCCHYCRVVTTFLFSHVGLVCLLFGYSVVGAFVFMALEADNEVRQRAIIKRRQQKLVDRLWTVTEQSALLKQSDWTETARVELRNFELALLEAVRKQGYDGNDEDSDDPVQWSFSGALLYSIIVITTIGYGNVAPRTEYGKIVTILYAVLGIPLMLFCLSNIGDALARSFKFIYFKCCCCLCQPKRRRRPSRRRRRASQRRRRLKQATEELELQTLQSPAVTSVDQQQHHHPFQQYPYQSVTQAHYATFPYRSGHHHHRARHRHDHLDLSVIANPFADDDLSFPSRLSDNLPTINISSPSSGFPGPPPTPTTTIPSSPPPDWSSTFGMATSTGPTLTTLGIPTMTNQAPTKMPVRFNFNFETASPQTAPASMANHPPSFNRNPPPIGGVNRATTRRRTEDSTDYSTEDTDSEDSGDKKQASIPIFVCLLVVVSYVCAGALLFMFWENWSFLDASYFCFVTLSTIGFGDLVPGQAVLSYEDGQLTLAICALYLVFGMALLAMSLNLVKEKVTRSVRDLGQRIGILVSDDDSD